MILILCCPNLGASTETDDQTPYISPRTLAECKRSVALGRNIIIKRDIVKKSRSGGGSCISDASSVDETSIETSSSVTLSSGSSVSEEENEVSYNVLLVGPLAQLQVDEEGNSGTDCDSSTWSSDTGGSLSAYSTSSLFTLKETDNSVSS